MSEDNERTHGQTYGEAVQDILERSINAINTYYKAANHHRKLGNNDIADHYESIANDLAEDALALADKRERMPFGIESAQGFGEVMENDTITFLERLQRGEVDDDE